MKYLLSLTLPLIMAISAIQAQASEEGRWVTISDETNKPQSIVIVEIKDDKLYATIDKILPPKDPNSICEQCPAPYTDKPVVGMKIVDGLKFSKKSKRWKGGQIFSPDKKRSYKTEIWLDEKGQLNVRGYMGFVYRTQIWVREEP